MLERCRTFRFSLHNLIGGEVSGPRWFTAPVEHELAFHKSDSAPFDFKAGVEVVIGTAAYRPGALGGSLLEWEGSHLGARWRTALYEKKEGGLLLNVAGNRLTRFIVAKWLVEPAVRVAAVTEDIIMTHAASLSDGRKSILVSGPGGAGKTTWTLQWLDAGHPYLCDDFSLVDQGKCLPYVTPLRLGLKNVLQSRTLQEMGTAMKTEAAARTLLRRATLGRAKFYLKAPLHKAVPAAVVSGPAPLGGALLLRKPKDKQDRKVTRLSAQELAELQAGIDSEEMHGFGRGKDVPLAGGGFYLEKHKRLLAGLLEGLPCFQVPSLPLPEGEALESVDTLISHFRSKASI